MCYCLRFLILFIFFGCTSNREKIVTQANVKKFISSLPSEERILLDFFFRSLVQQDVIGYTLVGGKAMSFYSYLKPKCIVHSYHGKPAEWLDLFFEGFGNEDALFHKGFEIWKKYEHRFCGNTIFFDVIEQDDELHFVRVFVFNKRLMISLFDRHFNKFASLDPSITNSEFLFNLLLYDQKFKEKFHARDDLFGMCLGYGEKNAELFYRREQILTSTGKLLFTLEKPSLPRLRSLNEELSAIEGVLKTGIKDHTTRKFLFHQGMGFCANFSDPETLILQKKYGELYKKVAQAYEGGAFLEKTLELICIEENQSL